MQKEMISKYIGQQIKKYRLSKGLTQKELGMMIGVKHNTISSYESGTNRPEGNILFALAKALNISIDDLFPTVNPSLTVVEPAVAESGAQYYTTSAEVIMLPIVGSISFCQGFLSKKFHFPQKNKTPQTPIL